MRKTLTIRVEAFEKEDREPRVFYWFMYPEHLVPHAIQHAQAMACMVKTYSTVEGNDIPENRKPYFDYDGTLRERDPKAWIEYEGVRHFEAKPE